MLKHPNAQGRPLPSWPRGLGTPRLQPVCPHHPHFCTSFGFISCIKVWDDSGREGHPRWGSSREQSPVAPRAVGLGWAGSSRARGFEPYCKKMAAWAAAASDEVMSRRCPGDVPATKSTGAGSVAPPQSQPPAPQQQQLPSGFLCYFFNSGCLRDAFAICWWN